MPTEKKIHRDACHIMRKCGTRFHPVEYAYSRMDRDYNKGFFDSAAHWARVANTIIELLKAEDSRKSS